MKLPINTAILDAKGETITQQLDGETMTIGSLSIMGLSSVNPDSKKEISATDKFKRGALAIKIQNIEGLFVDISIEELALIKQLIGEIGSPVVVARAWQLLENLGEDKSNNKKNLSKENAT